MNRRQFVIASAVPALAARADTPQEPELKFQPMHTGRRPEIGMLLYPGLTLMDLLGPQTALSTSCNVHLVWKSRDFIESDTGIGLRPTATLADCPKELDAIFVGGGPGQFGIMNDSKVIGFLADRGSRAKYVTSVCSGSLLLGAAGLMRGYKATSHWACREYLPLFGATPVDARVVVDRNRVTGGGVTAGLDFGLVLLAKLLGEDIAKMSQLAMEYDPKPPFHAGTPKEAGPEITKKVRDWLGPLDGVMRQVCEQSAKAMPR
ncbi:DJ-1/PfpI family protein [Singulisphaera acidiphila]|uniref:Transcriptional regulator containing an amidase domain and an AraC-type DNA-binding HTH domain n=1 Tax=Singulisphaera acidiphila (strain ATCC BAA-1392 / DSM 18658 / VKM B-2454 / MOB10) TaxID=886293 RepID=L0DG46_SINAD|nr:DJ-1/PfpI family protein [Singulisphaera acidiphila]AGA28344.1 transcriptional regulator containing an amidase domain and an AraC-type DNA-binding HTH domain [Singulisphaera acidiphila DSM 18658]